MKLQMLCLLSAALLIGAPQAEAEKLDIPQQVTAEDIKPNLPQPYIVKKGDTLWDIANYFFKDPKRWLKIWEHNLYITNPDLIYPGNEIWFDASRQDQGGLVVVRPQPKVVIKPVERLEKPVDTSMILTALKRQDFIQPSEVEGVGYILDSEDERINYGRDDRLYLKFNTPVKEGDIFDVFRSGDPIRDPRTGKVAGLLVNHLGQIQVTSQAGGIYRGVVLNAFAELSRGDRLKPAKHIAPRITPSRPDKDLRGVVMYIRNNATEAGQHQVVGITLGLKDGLRSGSVLSVYRAGRTVEDRITGEEVRLPEEKIAQLMVLVPQQAGSIALVTQSSAPINIGDSVHSLDHE